MGLSIEIIEEDYDDFEIETHGSFSNIITDTDRRKFKVTDRRLKDAVEEYKGKRPTDVYLCSPTPWGDMYTTYDIDQTEKIIEIIDAKVVNVWSEPVVIKKEVLRNNHPSEPSKFNTSIEETVTNTLSSSWTNENKLSFEGSIGYDLKALKRECKMSFSKGWGDTKTKSKSVTFKSGSSTETTLKPGQRAIVEMTANKKFAEIEITYKCHLEGHVGINYHERYKGYHFHFVPIETIMEAGGIKNSIIVKEVIELELYNYSGTTVN